MDTDSDDDFERVSDYVMSGSESEGELPLRETPGSTPPSQTLPCRQKTLKCPYNSCDKAYNRQARLQEHLRTHTNTRPFKCPHSLCAKDYLRESHLNHHIKSAHSDVRDYKCTWEGCDKAFATGTRLRRHIETHEGQERFRCRGYEGCHETFRKRETLQRHVTTVHEKKKPFPCPDADAKTGVKCTKAFDTAEKLRQHQRNNHDPTRFSCSECLANNATVMADVDIKSVDLADVFFSTYSALQTHMAEVHPPTCSFCAMAFKTSRELTRHLELQHDVKTSKGEATKAEYKCTYPKCNKSYSKQGNLNVHVKTTHQKRRDFICGKTEISLPDDIAEDTVVHGCGRDFTSKASLLEHVRTAHLGLESERKKREKKRKAEVEEDNDEENFVTKKVRHPRKDKGTKKSSAITALTGLALADSAPIKQEAMSPLDDAFEYSDDDYNELSGSMVIHGNHLIHSGVEYDWVSGQYPPGHLPPTSSPELFTSAFPGPRDTQMHDSDDEGFFGDFEPEPSAVVDPQLLDI